MNEIRIFFDEMASKISSQDYISANDTLVEFADYGEDPIFKCLAAVRFCFSIRQHLPCWSGCVDQLRARQDTDDRMLSGLLG